MNDRIIYKLVIKSPPEGDLEGLWKAATRNMVKAIDLNKIKLST
jgi:hypothetical protein